jgi:uncharacterized membrane protein YdbT with pleckstrin-like domain
VSYVDTSLLPNERVTHRARLSRVIFVGPAIALVIGILCLLGGRGSRPVAVIFLVVGGAAALVRYVNFTTSEFAITDKRVIIKVGLLRRRTLELQLTKLEAIAVDQGILGRIFGYGNIVVTGTGGTKEPFKTISGPLEFRRAAQAATS